MESACGKMRAALQVMVQTPSIRQFLWANDPKALQQAMDALDFGYDFHGDVVSVVEGWVMEDEQHREVAIPTRCDTDRLRLAQQDLGRSSLSAIDAATVWIDSNGRVFDDE